MTRNLQDIRKQMKRLVEADGTSIAGDLFIIVRYDEEMGMLVPCDNEYFTSYGAAKDVLDEYEMSQPDGIFYIQSYKLLDMAIDA